jgi:hypothetical protein
MISRHAERGGRGPTRALGILLGVALAGALPFPGAAQGSDDAPEVHSPWEAALRSLNEADSLGVTLPAVERLDLLYLVAAEKEPWVDTLQAELDERLAGVGTPADSTLALGYLGALEVLRAKHGTWPPSRIKWVRRGVGRLDGLVQDHPTDVHLRYLRTVSTLFLPGFMGRGEEARSDMERLAELLSEAGKDLEPYLRGRVAGFVLEYGDWLGEGTRADVSEVIDAEAAPGLGAGS